MKSIAGFILMVIVIACVRGTAKWIVKKTLKPQVNYHFRVK